MKSKFLLTLFLCCIVSVTAYAYTWPAIEGNNVIQQLCEEDSEGFVVDGAVLSIDTDNSAVNVKAQILAELAYESVYFLKPLDVAGAYALYKEGIDDPVLVAIHLMRQVLDEEDEGEDILDGLGNTVVDLSHLPVVFASLDIQSAENVNAALVRILKSMKKKYRRSAKNKTWDRDVKLDGKTFVWKTQNPKKIKGGALFGDLCEHVKGQFEADSWESRFTQALETRFLMVSTEDEICTFKCGKYEYKFSLSEQKEKKKEGKKSCKKKTKNKSRKDDFEKAGEDTIEALSRVRRVVKKAADDIGDGLTAFEREAYLGLTGKPRKRRHAKRKK